MGSQAVAAHRAMKVEARHNTAQVGEDHVFVSGVASSHLPHRHGLVVPWKVASQWRAT